MTTARQNTKTRKAQIYKIVQSGGVLGSLLGKRISKLGKKVVSDLIIPFARDSLLGLISNITSNAINKFERKIREKGAVRADKGFSLFISIEDLDDIIKIMKSLEDLGVLVDGVTEPIKHEMKNKKVDFLMFW